MENKQYVFTNILTKETVLWDKSPNEFCHERNLDYNTFRHMIGGKTKSSQGWCIGTEIPERKHTGGATTDDQRLKAALLRKPKDFVGHNFINWKTGEKKFVLNYSEFARYLNTHLNCVIKVAKNKSQSVNDFVIDKEEYHKAVIDEDGVKYTSVFEAAMKNNSFPWKIVDVCNGLTKITKKKSYSFC